MSRFLFTFSILIVSILSITTDWYYSLSTILSILLLLLILDKIGKGIVLRETICLMYILTCIIMPILGYKYYNISNALSKIWVRFMPLSKEDYFSYALPAIAFFCLALTLPFKSSEDNEQGEGVDNLVLRIKERLVFNPKLGIVILTVGVFVSFWIAFLPAGLQFFATLIFFGSFAGFLYIYYSPKFKYKGLILGLFILFIIYNAISIGMFTIVAYMAITIFSFLMLGKRINLIKKVMLFLSAAFLLIVLQNVKLTYRKQVWKNQYQGNKVELFTQIFIDNFQKGDDLFEVNSFFPIYTRGNQGYNVSLVMKRIPALVPHDDGSNLVRNFMSALVPRFLWPDKPEAGGKFNMKYYTGWDIVGWSTNVGPLGEAYGSFGRTGGTIYMFFLGLFIRWAYLLMFRLSRKIPLLICWLPAAFFQIISSSETDSLQIFNSLIKGGVFLWIIYIILPKWLGIHRHEQADSTKQTRIILNNTI